jgi:hypothetical protein
MRPKIIRPGTGDIFVPAKCRLIKPISVMERSALKRLALMLLNSLHDIAQSASSAERGSRH